MVSNITLTCQSANLGHTGIGRQQGNRAAVLWAKADQANLRTAAKPQQLLSALACLFYSKQLYYKTCIRASVLTSHFNVSFQCSYVPGNSENAKEVKAKIEEIANNFKKYQTFPCYYDPGGMQTNVILSRLYPPRGLLFTFLWPTLMFTGGCLIIVLVKISQYVSVLSARQQEVNIWQRLLLRIKVPLFCPGILRLFSTPGVSVRAGFLGKLNNAHCRCMLSRKIR